MDSYERLRGLELRGDEGKCWEVGLQRWATVSLWKVLHGIGLGEISWKWTLRFTTLTHLQDFRCIMDIPDFILAKAPAMSICKVLEMILSGSGHFAAIKCPYKLQCIGSNVWFPIFLSICVSPVIRVPKCSVHQSAQSDFSIKTERKESSLQQIAKWKRPSVSISRMGPCVEIYVTYNCIPHFFL